MTHSFYNKITFLWLPTNLLFTIIQSMIIISNDPDIVGLADPVNSITTWIIKYN